MGRDELKTLFSCFLRTYLIGSMYNTKGLQNLGLLYIMDPGLKMFYKDRPDEYFEARKRYLGHYNSHPYFLPLLVGYFLFLESKIAQGIINRDSLETIKQTSAYTLSALGDSLFEGSLIVSWAFIEILFLLYDLKIFAISFFILCFFILQLFRFIVFWEGWSKGLSFFQYLREANLIEWSNRIKILNGFFLVWIWYRICCLSHYNLIIFFFVGGLALAIFSFLVYRHVVIRELVVALLLFSLLFL